MGCRVALEARAENLVQRRLVADLLRMRGEALMLRQVGDLESCADVAQRVVRLHPAIKVLYVSGFTNQIALDSGILSRRASFLAKPFTPQALAKKVRECLDARS